MKYKTIVFAIIAFSCGDKSSSYNTNSMQQASKPAQFRRIAVDPGATMRNGASVSSDSLGVIPFESRIEVLSESYEDDLLLGLKGKWLKVRYKEKEGWVFAPLTSKEDDSLRLAFLSDVSTDFSKIHDSLQKSGGLIQIICNKSEQTFKHANWPEGFALAHCAYDITLELNAANVIGKDSLGYYQQIPVFRATVGSYYLIAKTWDIDSSNFLNIKGEIFSTNVCHSENCEEKADSQGESEVTLRIIGQKNKEILAEIVRNNPLQKFLRR